MNVENKNIQILFEPLCNQIKFSTKTKLRKEIIKKIDKVNANPIPKTYSNINSEK